MNGKQAIWMMAAALSVAGCGRQTTETVPLSAPVTEAQPESVAAPLRTKISGVAALDEVRRFVELGPKGSGTPGAKQAAAYLLGRLQAAGVDAEIQEFKDMTPIGDLTFRNVLGRIPGGTGKIVLIGAHYDTKVGIEGFVGANDSGSGTGLLIELARALQQTAPHPVEIRFALFDGEEARMDYSPIDGFHGSRHLAETMVADGSASNTAAMILLDMVGDRDLSVTMPRNSRPWLLTLAFESARQEGVRKYFQLSPYSFGDDHEAFMKQGVPAIDFIDFLYGSAPGKNDYWHKATDTLDKVSAESLEIVGRVVLRMLDGIEQRDPAAEK